MNQISSITVPKLLEDQLYYTVSANTGFQATSDSFSLGSYILLRAEYRIDSKHNTSGQWVTIDIPDGIEIMNGIVVNGKPESYSSDGGSIKIMTNSERASISCYAIAKKVGEYRIRAYLSFNNSGAEIQQPIGTAVFEASAAKIKVPRVTNVPEITANGIAIPDCSITVYDNETEVGRTSSNKNGTWQCRFNLMDYGSNFAHHDIYAVIKPDTSSEGIATNSEEVIYCKDYVQVLKITMINTGHGTSSLTPIQYVSEFDFQNPSSRPPQYWYWPSYPVFTFYVEFTGDSSNISQAFVVTTNSAGDETFVPVTYDQASKCWVGTHKYASNEIPVSVSATYSTDIDA